MATKKKVIEKLYVEVPRDDIVAYKTSQEAIDAAKEDMEYGNSGTRVVLEVTKFWVIEIPDDPEPEVTEESLEELL